MLKKLALIISIVLAGQSANAQVEECIRISTVSPILDLISITNATTATVDLSDYRLCSLFNYTNSGIAAETTVLSGNVTALEPGELLVVTWEIDDNAADLGLYLPTGAFSDPSAMVDFMQYGASGQGRETEAAAAGLWVAGEFVSTANTMVWLGDCNNHTSSAWFTSTGVEDLDQKFMSVYPNPVDDHLNIDLNIPNSRLETLSVTDVAGKVMYATSFSKNDDSSIRMNISDWAGGMYFVQLRHDNGTLSVTRLVK